MTSKCLALLALSACVSPEPVKQSPVVIAMEERAVREMHAIEFEIYLERRKCR